MENASNCTMLNDLEMTSVHGGELITISLVATILAISILTVLVWKLYTSSKGEIQLPGGFKFNFSAGIFKAKRI